MRKLAQEVSHRQHVADKRLSMSADERKRRRQKDCGRKAGINVVALTETTTPTRLST